MTKQLRMIVAATLVFGQTLPAAAQRVVTEVAPVAVRGPAAVSVAPAATLGTAASLQRAPLALAAPVVAPAPILGAKAGSAAKATPLAAIQARRQAIAGAMPKAQVSSLAPAAAYSTGVGLEDAMTGGRSNAAAATETPSSGFWRSLVPSGLSRAARAAAPAAEPASEKGSRPEQASAELQAKVEAKAELLARIRTELERVIIGQDDMKSAIIMGLMAGEHVLLEGVPGVGKTATVKAISDATEAKFSRVQGTPDKLPSDILGSELLFEDPATGIKGFKVVVGPIVANILLVDEINRMMPKTQSALLEAMQERQITIGKERIKLPAPFIVLATQNPLEQEGVYKLPEAQQDRFMFKVIVRRPSPEQQEKINTLQNSKEPPPVADKVTSIEELAEAGKLAREVYVSDQINKWITHIVEATNDPDAYGLDIKKAVQKDGGASPRAGIFLYKAAQVHAFLQGRSWVERSDVFAMAPLILRHRLILSYEALASNVTVEQVIDKVMSSQAVWRAAEKGKPGAKAGALN